MAEAAAQMAAMTPPRAHRSGASLAAEVTDRVKDAFDGSGIRGFTEHECIHVLVHVEAALQQSLDDCWTARSDPAGIRQVFADAPAELALRAAKLGPPQIAEIVRMLTSAAEPPYVSRRRHSDSSPRSAAVGWVAKRADEAGAALEERDYIWAADALARACYTAACDALDVLGRLGRVAPRHIEELRELLEAVPAGTDDDEWTDKELE